MAKSQLLPISPRDLPPRPGITIPDSEIEDINAAIKHAWDGEAALVEPRGESPNALIRMAYRQEVADMYRARGWSVHFIRPGEGGLTRGAWLFRPSVVRAHAPASLGG